MLNPFFSNSGPFTINEIFKALNIGINGKESHTIENIKDLLSADSKSITFFHSKKYQDIAKKTKAKYCITTHSLKNHLPNNCYPIVVDNVLVATSIITEKFYPNSIEDEHDITTIDICKSDFAKSVNAGKNVLIGNNVIIGNNCCFVDHLFSLKKSLIFFAG